MQKQSPLLVYGLIGGGVAVLFMVVMYFIDAKLVSAFSSMLVEVAITVIFMVLAVVAHRKANNGVIDFRTALRTTYGTAVIAWLMFCIFYFILYKFIDPNLIKLYYKNMADTITEMGKQKGISEQDIALEITRRQQSGFRFDNPSTMFFMYLFLIILSFFYSLIIAGIISFTSKGNTNNIDQNAQLS